MTAVEAAGIHKRFGSTHALRGVDLSLVPGRCLGLVGRNGAGKSTLVSILSGIYPPDEGKLTLNVPIATVFQHSMVVPHLTVAENVFLGAPPTKRGMVDWRAMRAQTRAVMTEWGFQVPPDEPCANLTVEQRQVVEIARALAAGTRCLLLDEPTAALERAAVQRLFERVRQLVASDVAVLYISHHLEEVFEICSDVAVLRDGEMVLTAQAAAVTKSELVTAMVGDGSSSSGGAIPPRPPLRTGELPAPPFPPGEGFTPPVPQGEGFTPPVPPGEGSPAPVPPEQGRASPGPPQEIQTPLLLNVRGVSVAAPGAQLRDVSFSVRSGERVGVTGLRGSGALALGRVIAGMTAPDSGEITLNGAVLRPGDRTAALRAGVGYIPEDRQADGFVPLFSVAENMTMTIIDRLARYGFVSPRRREQTAAPLAGRLSVVSAGLAQPTGELSGGNQQKVTVARALARDPELIVAITPTRGVDVASKELLLAELDRAVRDTGAGLLLASDELDDLVICDRVFVMVRGEIFAEFASPPFDNEALIAASEGLEVSA